MAVINLSELTIKETRRLLQAGEISARELIAMHEAEIKKYNPHLNAYLEYFNDAFEYAEKVDERLKAGMEPKELEGVPFAIKDNILIKGKIASAASRILENYRASYDAHVIKKLKNSGALFLGRTNMDEFAMGSSTENSAFGPTKNPVDENLVPGGSSGGSAAAVARGLAVCALGSDTGGSIRQPAAFCGVVGLKPTYSAVSRSGLIAMASSLDQIGPMARTVDDVETIFSVIRGRDPMDATTVDYVERTITRKPVIGIPREYRTSEGGIDEQVEKVFNKAQEVLLQLGYEVKEISLPHTLYALAVYYIIMPAEVSSNLSRFDGIRYGLSENGRSMIESYIQTRSQGFGREARRRILLGSYVLSAGYYDAYYARAEKVRTLIVKDFENAFREVDAILTPTTPTPAFSFGEKADDPLQMYLSDIFTVPANLAGIPAISIPFGEITTGNTSSPIGIQLMAPWFFESTLFTITKELEKYKEYGTAPTV